MKNFFGIHLILGLYSGVGLFYLFRGDIFESVKMLLPALIFLFLIYKQVKKSYEDEQFYQKYESERDGVAERVRDLEREISKQSRENSPKA